MLKYCLPIAVVSALVPAVSAGLEPPTAAPWTCLHAPNSYVGGVVNSSNVYQTTQLNSGQMIEVPALASGTPDDGYVTWALDVGGYNVGVLPGSNVKVRESGSDQWIEDINSGSRMVFTSLPTAGEMLQKASRARFQFTSQHASRNRLLPRKIRVKVSGTSSAADGTVFGFELKPGGVVEVKVLEGTVKVKYVRENNTESAEISVHSFQKITMPYDRGSGPFPVASPSQL